MTISKDIAVWLRTINTAPAMATKLFNKRDRFLWLKRRQRPLCKSLTLAVNDRTQIMSFFFSFFFWWCKMNWICVASIYGDLPNLVVSGVAESDPSKPPMQKMDTVKDQMREICHCSSEMSYLCRHVSFTSFFMNCNYNMWTSYFSCRCSWSRTGWSQVACDTLWLLLLYLQRMGRSSQIYWIHTETSHQCQWQIWQRL